MSAVPDRDRVRAVLESERELFARAHPRSRELFDAARASLVGGRPRSREGNVGPAVDPVTTTKVCEWGDLGGVRAMLGERDVACVLTEPALTNIGIVLPEPGFLAGLEEA